MKKIINFVWLIIPLLVNAQPPDQDKVPPPNEEKRGAMMAWKITESLDLSEEQAEKFFPKFNKHRDEMEGIEKKQNETLKYIREALKDGKDISEKDLEKAIAEYESFESQKLSTRVKFLKGLDGVLNTNQQAELLMLPHGMKQEAKEHIMDRKEFRKRRQEKRW